MWSGMPEEHFLIFWGNAVVGCFKLNTLVWKTRGKTFKSRTRFTAKPTTSLITTVFRAFELVAVVGSHGQCCQLWPRPYIPRVQRNNALMRGKKVKLNHHWGSLGWSPFRDVSIWKQLRNKDAAEIYRHSKTGYPCHIQSTFPYYRCIM
jgi:hypothetical protein